MSCVTLYCEASALLGIFFASSLASFVYSLVEQAKTKERRDEKERRMTMELKAAISDRDSLKKNEQALREEMEKELSLTRAR